MKGGRRSAGALLALALLAAGGPAPAAEPVAAVWKEHQVSFSYSSARNVYSCDDLRTRVTALLHAVGARPDLQVKVDDCDTSRMRPDLPTSGPGSGTWEVESGSSRSIRSADRPYLANIRVRLWMPVEMTPDVVEEMKADKSRRELISRVTGNPIPRFNDPIPFAAERRVVTLSRKTVGLDPEECELLDQLVTGVFRQLDLRNVRRYYSCDRYRDSRIPPTVEVEALLAATPESRETAEGPAAGEEESESAPEPITLPGET